MTTYTKARAWNGKDLDGRWIFTTKRDGVRAMWNGTEWRSRADKPLYNIPAWVPGMPTDCEVYVGSFRDTIRATRTKHLKADTPAILPEHLFRLDGIDPRNKRIEAIDPTIERIGNELGKALAEGFEGLVLIQGDKWLKVKPEDTTDLLITGAVEGEGKHVGRLGAIDTVLGEIGTGFSDAERDELWAEFKAGTLIGQTVECSYMHLTDDGKMRHARFERMRPDKVADR
jgi:ATP-dependent DNA ligase